MPKKARTILAPRVDSKLTGTGDKLTFWKQILPESEIQYVNRGKTRHINFDSSYHHDLIEDFKAKRAIDQVHFQLAGSDNSHGRDWDPERQRAIVTDMATYDELPDDVKAKVGTRGLYAKMRFFSKKHAKAVLNNPDLGVSARVRENFPRSDGTMVKRGIIHVLGTIDPRVPGMSGWQGADLSYDSQDGYVLDLSNESYEGDAEMAKKTRKKSEVRIPTVAEIDAMSEEELDAYLAEEVEDVDDELEDLEDDESEEDEDEDDDDEDDDEDEPATSKRTKETVSLSNTTKRRRQTNAIDLANARADAAESKADRALRRQAERDFLDFSNAEIALGVPPEAIEECEEILTRPDGMVVDLSNEGGSSDLDVTDIVKGLLQRLRGTIDMSQESGHGGQFDANGGADDPDKEMLDALANGR